ncbi:ATP-dependent zinc protease family protein [Arenimonas fontis]|uniref:ATP-dependent zinc protease n=1 Tax=Arenimonas fontis TaxID=2608255 RepID=A0A5B2ZDZ0_9GAMM|nr:RimK/LysX family protein [Arenimonas fontis]KAA2285281.1 ATP-dependent zinc protease [Arenimonas fontis]
MPQPVCLGWREWVALPALGIVAMRAKVDTGARSSALHVEFQESFRREGVEWVRFAVATGVHGFGDSLAEAPVLDRRSVTDSGGHSTQRVFIRTSLRLAGQEWEADINLTRRRNMLFPMLLGRTALAGRFVVDPAASFLHGQEPPTS